MSRLTPGDIAYIEKEIGAYDEEFAAATGKSMLECAREDFPFFASLKNVRAAVVPVTGGLGLIAGFAPGVRAILEHAGCQAFVTARADAAGLGEACRRGADVVFMADDEEYIALALGGRAVSFNGAATGVAFARALALAAEGVRGKEVLVLGLGAVGLAAAKHLAEQGARVGVYDTDETRLAAATACRPEFRAAPAWRAQSHRYVLDATPVAGLLAPEHIRRGAVLSLPGIPLGADARVTGLCAAVIANPLELGTIAMLAQVLSLAEGTEGE
ncbi:MAG: 3-methylornithyl-N6-L-lysine dehydrogenase PylD [Gracilibacteraceae bacterium]|nr:3-methylornithyl-N6-L-lysine dehydrogenase PylD [Gracilibacteraceae bacterium]